jgi:hypothetical protein
MRDLYDNIGVVHLLDAQDIAATDTSSDILDLQGFDSAVIAVNIGAITTPASTSYITPVLQESDTTDDADFEDVDSDDILGGFSKIDAATEDQTTQIAGYIGSKRYIRVKLDVTNTGGGISACLVSVDGIVGHAKESPVTAPAAVSAT